MLRCCLSNAVRSLRFYAVILSLLAGTAHAAPFAYITNRGSNNVSVIDIACNTVVATVAVAGTPKGVAVNPNRTRVYVVSQPAAGDQVSVIDTDTGSPTFNTVVGTVLVGASPEGVAVNPGGTRVYVTNTGSNTISVIETAGNTVVATVPVGTNPGGVAVNPAGTRVYVVNAGNGFGSGTVSVIETAGNTVVATVTVGIGVFPRGVAVNPAGTRVYVANAGSDTVAVIETAGNTVVATVPVGTFPFGVAVNPAGTFAYITGQNSNNVSVIETAGNTVAATVPVGFTPQGVAVNPAGTRAYVANAGASANVSVIDITAGSPTLNTVVATVAVGANPVAFGLFIGGPSPASPPTITNGPPPNGTIGVAYNFAYTPTGCPPAFSVTAGALPPGLTLSPAGVISGTPTATGTFSGTVTATNGTAPNATQNFSIRITAPPTITNGPPPNGRVGVAYNFTYTSTGSPTFSVTSGSLPPGLTLSPAGVISGTPTTAGTFTGTVTATNGTAPDATQAFSIMISLCGDANGDGQVTVADVFYMVNNLFTGGPPPVNSFDVNGDGNTTVTDIFYMVNFLFANGAAPMCP